MKRKTSLTIFIIILLCLFAILGACKDKMLTIKYYDNDNLIEETQIKKGLCISSFQPPEKMGYAFTGWYSDKDLTNQVSSDYQASKNASLYAKYQQQTYTVIFQIDGYDDIVRYATYGVPIDNIPSIPEKKGHNSRWDRSDFSNIHADTVIKAIYSPIELTVTFKIEGHSDIIKYVLYGHELMDIPPISEIEGKSSKWDIDNFTNVTSNLITNAIYEDIYLTVQFISQHPAEPNQTYIESKEVLYGKDLPFSHRPTQPHSFDGYTGVWEHANYYNITVDITVNASYTPNPIETKFLVGGETITIIMPYNTIPFSYVRDTPLNELGIDASTRKSILEPPAPSSLDDINNRNVRYGSTSTDINSPLKGAVTMQIIWDIFVTLESGGGEFQDDVYNHSPLIIPYNTTLNRPTFKDRYGYNFIGWFLDAGFNEEFFFNSTLTDDIELYAEWEQIFCQIAFPEIDGISFYSDTSNPVPFGDDFSFTISNNIDISEVWANDILLLPQENTYHLNQIEEDINIAVKTNDIAVYTLTFYNDTDTELLFTRKVSANQKLYIIPQPEERYLSSFSWRYHNQDFNFETENIIEDMRLTLAYIRTHYNVRYIFGDGKYKEFTVVYQNEDFEFYSPKAEEDEREDNMLFEGWYLDNALTDRATKKDIINSGASIILYSKWIPIDDIEHSIIGLWYADLFLLELLNNGTAKIYNGHNYMECSFMLGDDNSIMIMGQEAILNESSNSISFLGKALTKTESEKCFIYSHNTGLFIIDNFIITYDMPELYWYLDNNFSNIIDITQPIEPSLFINRKLELFPSPYRYITINYNAMGGVTEGNVSVQKITISSTTIFIPLQPTYAGYIFRGWRIEGTDELLTWNTLYYSNKSTINVQAVYLEEHYIVDKEIVGSFITKSEVFLYIAEFTSIDFPHYTVTTINLNDFTHITSIPYLYYWNEDKQQFIDEYGIPITLDIDNGTLSLTYKDIVLEMIFNLSGANPDTYYKYSLGAREVLVYFTNGNAAISIDGEIYDVYLYDNCYYYFSIDNRLTYINHIFGENLEVIDRQLPEEYVGRYYAYATVEDFSFEFECEILSIEVGRFEYAINEEPRESEDIYLVNYFDNYNYAVMNKSQDILFIFAIIQEDEVYHYYMYIDNYPIELSKIEECED